MFTIRVVKIIMSLLILFGVQECFDLDWGANKDAEMMQSTLSKSHLLTEQAEIIASGQATPTLALYRYEGQGSYTITNNFHDKATSCTTTFNIYATIDQNDVVHIYGGGPCFENYDKCILSSDPNNQCATEAKGVKEGLESIDLTFCNTEKVSIGNNNVMWSETQIWGSYECILAGESGDTISLTFDLPRVPWK